MFFIFYYYFIYLLSNKATHGYACVKTVEYCEIKMKPIFVSYVDLHDSLILTRNQPFISEGVLRCLLFSVFSTKSHGKHTRSSLFELHRKNSTVGYFIV